MKPKVVVVDYGMGNLTTVHRKLLALGADAVVSGQPSDLDESDRIVLPGVGHFSHAMRNLRLLGLVDPLRRAALGEKKPILGICLGMQLMAASSEEGDGVAGLGWIEGDVVRFAPQDSLRFRVPHVGWNRVTQQKASLLLEDIADGSEFYFLHSYYLRPRETKEILLTAEHETSFVCAVQKENVFGVQFHPEKSHQSGMRLLENFLKVPTRAAS